MYNNKAPPIIWCNKILVENKEYTNKSKTNIMNRVLTTKEFEMPVGVLIEVSDIMIENDLFHNIIATDEENNSVTIEISYAKEDRDAIHQIQDIIDDFYEEYDEDNDEDEDEDED